MSDKPVSNNSTATWIISIVAALVLYVLSIGPVWVLADVDKPPFKSVQVVAVIYRPVWWITKKLDLHWEMAIYIGWWRWQLK